MNASQLQARMEEILELPSSTRIAEAGKLGRDHSSDANLVKLITPLLNHEPPVAPDLTTDDGLSEIIPPQKRNVAKHFDSHWTALVLAAASKSAEAVALLVEELKYAHCNWNIRVILILCCVMCSGHRPPCSRILSRDI